MKRMRAKYQFILPLLVLMFIGTSFIVVAEEPKEAKDLDPLIYEKLEFKKNTDYLHDKQKTEMKNTIPEKQFDIYFDGRNKLPNRGDTSFLFQTAERGEKSTVTAKSSELKLFSSSDTKKLELSAAEMKEEKSSNNSVRTILFFGIIALGVLMLFVILLPRLVNANDSKIIAK